MTTTGGDMTFAGNVTLSNGPFTFNTGGGSLSIAGNLAAGGRNVILASGIGAGATTVGGNVSGLGTGTGAALSVQSGVTGLVWFQGTVAAAAGLTAPVGSSLRFDGDVTLAAGNTGTSLAGNVQLDGLTFSGSNGITLGTVTLSSAPVSINSGNSALRFTGTVSGGQNLNLTAGTGTIDFDATVGSGTRLGAVTIVSAAGVTFDDQLQAASVTQQAGSGTTTFSGAVNTNAAAGVSITSTNLVLNGGVTATGGGGLTAQLAGTASVSGTTSSSVAGPVSITAAGSITLGTAAVLSAAGAVLLKSSGNSITLQADAQLTGSTGNVVLEAEDSLLLGSGSIVTATLGDLILRSGLDSTDNTGGMTLDGTLRALAPGQAITLDLNDEQGATQNATTGGIQATSLRLRGNTTVTASFSLLGAAGNDVDVLAAETSGAVTFRDRDDLTIGSIAASSGMPTMAGISTVNGISEGAAISIIVSGALVANQPLRTSPTGGAGSSNSGTVTLQSLTSTLSLTDDSDITADGPVSLTAATGISTAAEITTSSDNITFASAVTLTAAVELSTGAAAGNILFSQAVNGPGALSLTAGTGTIDFDAAVGSGTRLGAVSIVSATDVTFDALLRAASVTQQAGSGTTTFTGAVDTNAAGGVAVTGTNLAFNGEVTTTGGGLTANLSGTAAVGASTSSSISGSIAITAAGSITVGASAIVSAGGTALLKTSGNSITLDLNSQLTGSTGNVVLEAEDSLLLRSGSVVTATLGELILRSGLDSTDNTGGMTLDGILRALTPGQSITLDLSDEQGATQNATTGGIQATNLRLRSNTAVAASFSLLGAAGNDVDILAAETSGAVTFHDRDDLTIGSIASSSGIPGMAGISTVNGTSEGSPISIIVSGALVANQQIRTSPTSGAGSSNLGTVTLQSLASTLSLTDNADITADGPVSLTAATGISTAAEITTSNDAVTLNSDVLLTGAVEITNAAGSADITFHGTVNGTADLTLTAGTGDIDFNQSVGLTNRLGQLQIVSVADLTFDSTAAAQNFVQVAGSGTTTITGLLSTTIAAGVNLTGTNLRVSAGISTTGNGVVTVLLSGSAPNGV
ncbi:MAG: beta strand repeat-containing protein, partial [Planctomycetaceae bacterium]